MVPLAVDVVSVQSQVVYGRVGNNVAVPTFAALGLTVAAVPTVLLSNTPHYASLHGGVVPEAWFGGWLDDLVARGALAHLRAVQTGYLGSAAQAECLATWIAARRVALPGLRVVVDPVVGDHDVGVYVDPALVELYRRTLVPLADGLTPNDFELACLTGRTIASVDDAVRAARTLLGGHVQWIAVTSAVPDAWAPDRMQVLLVTREAAHVITHPCVPVAAKGLGDLFAASLTGYWLGGAPPVAAAASACGDALVAARATLAAQSAELLLPRAHAAAGEVVVTPI